MPENWKADLKPLATNWEKPFLGRCALPLFVVFKPAYGADGRKKSSIIME